MGSWADGLITTSRPPEKLKKVVDAFRRGGGSGKPMILKVQLSYDNSEEKALQGAYQQWRNNIFKSKMLTELITPTQFDAAGEFVQPEELFNHLRISPDTQQHIEWLQKDIELGFNELILHNLLVSMLLHFRALITAEIRVLKHNNVPYLNSIIITSKSS